MDDEIHIASFIVQHLASASDTLDRFVESCPGLEIAARGEGRIVLLHECDGTRALLACMDAVQAVPGVINVNLVYHHAEPKPALGELLTAPDQ